MKSVFLTSILVITTSLLFSFQSPQPENVNKISGDLTITILYDNYKFIEDLESDWGFSCFIEGLDETILFDTGGIKDFLDSNHDVKVIMPVSFQENFKKMIESNGAEIVDISGPKEIMEGVRTTGEMGTDIIEQSLLIQTAKGSIIITGCALERF